MRRSRRGARASVIVSVSTPLEFRDTRRHETRRYETRRALSCCCRYCDLDDCSCRSLITRWHSSRDLISWIESNLSLCLSLRLGSALQSRTESHSPSLRVEAARVSSSASSSLLSALLFSPLFSSEFFECECGSERMNRTRTRTRRCLVSSRLVPSVSCLPYFHSARCTHYSYTSLDWLPIASYCHRHSSSSSSPFRLDSNPHRLAHTEYRDSYSHGPVRSAPVQSVRLYRLQLCLRRSRVNWKSNFFALSRRAPCVLGLLCHG